MAISALFVHALVEALERSGVPRERFLQAAAVDLARLESADARLSVTAFDGLLDHALSLSRDDAFGLRMAEMVNPGDYNLTTHLVAHAWSLRDAIDSLQRFHRLLSDRPFWRFVEGERTASLIFDAGPGSSPARRFRCEMTMSGFHKMLKYIAPRARPRVVGFDYPAPPYAAQYTRVFEGTERFDQAHTSMVFDRTLLDAAQKNRDPDLRAAIVSHAERRVSEIAKDAGYAERVRRHLLDAAPPDRRDMTSVARALGLSARTLRRRLDEEGTSFREVLDGALGTLAKRLVASGDKPIETAAYAMGFAHPSAFHRAFKRWTGATPGASRPPPARKKRRTRPRTGR